MGIRSIFLSSVFVSFAVPGTALAIPTQHLNPHSDDPADISWQQDPLAVPDDTNHLHIEDVNITYLPGPRGITHNNGTAPRDAGGHADQSWDWQSTRVWDDRFYRFVDDNGFNALGSHFGHGYIDPAFRPRYLYAADVPDDAKPLVDEAMSTWNERAKDEGEEKRTTPAGNPLKTSVIFERVASGAYELLVDFMEGFQEIAHAAAEWIFSPSLVGSDYPAADTPVPLTLMFEATPTGRISVTQDDWLVSTDGLPLGDVNKVYTSATEAFAMSWSFNKTPAILQNLDIDYMAPDLTEYEGDEAAFAALGITLTDNWGGYVPFNATSNIDIFEADFFSVALHEWGHVIGFKHSNGGIMGAAAPFSMGFVTQTIDDENAFGAAAMYSIPVPEPDSLLLFGAGFFALLAITRRKFSRFPISPLGRTVS